jgi:hypothetical protein
LGQKGTPEGLLSPPVAKFGGGQLTGAQTFGEKATMAIYNSEINPRGDRLRNKQYRNAIKGASAII